MVDFSGWTRATGNLDWGKQRVLHETLTLVADDQIKVVHGADSFQGSPCLINAVGCMVKNESETPMSNEPELVQQFDNICRQMVAARVMPNNSFLSPFGAEVLLYHFAPLKEIPAETPVAEIPEVGYREPTDREIAEAWSEANKSAAPSEDVYVYCAVCDDTHAKSDPCITVPSE